MTNADFATWVAARFGSRHAAARALGIDRDTLVAMMTGRRRKTGAPHPVPIWAGYMCAGFDLNVSPTHRSEANRAARPRKSARIDLKNAQRKIDELQSVRGAAIALGIAPNTLNHHIRRGALRKPYAAPKNARAKIHLATAQSILDAGGTAAQAGEAVGVSRVRITQAVSRGLLKPNARMVAVRRRMRDSDLDAASRLLMEGLSVREVADAVGFKPMSLYHHIRTGRLPPAKGTSS